MRSTVSSMSNEIQRLTLDAIEHQWFAGAVIRLEQEGEVLYEGAFGSAIKTAQLQAPMSATTQFDIASLTKLFTTTAILKLVSEGRLDLDAPLVTVADGKLAVLLGAEESGSNRRVADVLEKVSTRALLTHSSGIHYWYPFYAARESIKASARSIAGSPAGSPVENPAASPAGEPYSAFDSIFETVLARFPLQHTTIYSDINFMLAGFIVETVSGLPLHEAIPKLVCVPLGLERCAYLKDASSARNAFEAGGDSTYAATEFGNRIEMKMVADLGLHFSGWRSIDQPIVSAPNDGNCHYFFHGVAGHAGIFATARDLCRLGNPYARVDNANYIVGDLLEEAVTDHGNGRGLGFQFAPRYPQGCGHTGFTGTYLFVSRSRHLSLSILTNRLHVPEPRDIDPFRKAIAQLAITTI